MGQLINSVNPDEMQHSIMLSWFSLFAKIKKKKTILVLTLKVPRKKMHLKMSSAEVVCCRYLLSITDQLTIKANSVDPEQTAYIGAVCSGSTLFAIEAS